MSSLGGSLCFGAKMLFGVYALITIFMVATYYGLGVRGKEPPRAAGVCLCGQLWSLDPGAATSRTGSGVWATPLLVLGLL